MWLEVAGGVDVDGRDQGQGWVRGEVGETAKVGRSSGQEAACWGLVLGGRWQPSANLCELARSPKYGAVLGRATRSREAYVIVVRVGHHPWPERGRRETECLPVSRHDGHTEACIQWRAVGMLTRVRNQTAGGGSVCADEPPDLSRLVAAIHIPLVVDVDVGCLFLREEPCYPLLRCVRSV